MASRYGTTLQQLKFSNTRIERLVNALAAENEKHDNLLQTLQNEMNVELGDQVGVSITLTIDSVKPMNEKVVIRRITELRQKGLLHDQIATKLNVEGFKIGGYKNFDSVVVRLLENA